MFTQVATCGPRRLRGPATTAPCRPENAVSAVEEPRRCTGSPTCVPSHRGAHAPFQRGPRAAVRQPCWRPTSTVPYRRAHDPTRGAQGAAARLATPLLQRGSGAAAETTRSYTVGPLGNAYGSRGRPGRVGSHRGACQRGPGCTAHRSDRTGTAPARHPLSLSLSLSLLVEKKDGRPPSHPRPVIRVTEGPNPDLDLRATGD